MNFTKKEKRCAKLLLTPLPWPPSLEVAFVVRCEGGPGTGILPAKNQCLTKISFNYEKTSF